jgi:hypothetical protein
MNRKSFLKTLFTGLVATKLAIEFGAKAIERLEYREPPKTSKWVMNPAYERATHELEIIGAEGVIKPRNPTGFRKEAVPIRFEHINGELTRIPPYIDLNAS